MIMYTFIGNFVDHDIDTEEWTDLIDRGGLTRINETVFQLFVAMEKEVRQHLNAGSANEEKGVRDGAVKGIADNEDVQMYWAQISVNWVATESNNLLKTLINHWVTIRGFSCAGAFMEQYKQTNKKTVQKSKGRRKTLK